MTAPQALELATVTAIADRLRNQPNLFASVLSGLDAAEADVWPKLPAVFVVPLFDDADDTVAPDVESIQRFETTFGLAVVVASPNDPYGTTAISELATLLGTSRKILSGWKPPGAVEVMTYRRGRLVTIDGGRIEWRDEYSMRWWAQSQGAIT